MSGGKLYQKRKSRVGRELFRSYYGLFNYRYKRHYRVKYGENEFALGYNHINGIENFWCLCKVRLAKFRGG